MCDYICAGGLCCGNVSVGLWIIEVQECCSCEGALMLNGSLSLVLFSCLFIGGVYSEM